MEVTMKLTVPDQHDRDPAQYLRDLADDPVGWDLRRLGRDDQDRTNLADGRLVPKVDGRRPVLVTLNAQTKVSETNPSLRIR